MTLRRWLAVTMAVALAATGCGAAMPASAPSPLVAKDLPAFKRPALSGRAVDTAGLRGQVVVVKFFAKFCEPCKRTLPAVEALSRAHPDVAFVGVAVDEYEADAQEIVRAYGLTFPVVHDRGQVLAARFRVSEMPVSFVADRRGVVRWVGAAEQTETDLESAISAVADM